jgi:hypothetical protein
MSFFLFIPLISLFFEKICKLIYHRFIPPLPVFFPSDLDLFIIISGAREIRTSELIKTLKTRKIKTFLSIQNWDNLTSKNLLLDQPDYIGVMGNNCVKTVSSTQNIDSRNIIACGLPRFNPYRLNNLNNNHFNGRVFTILYLGTSLPHNEKNLLNSISNYLESAQISKKYKLIYKPHPNRRPRYLEEVLNPKVEVNSVSTENYPKISSEHIALITQADLIVSAPTSMIIEVLLLNKNIIIDLTNDRVHRTTAALAFQNYDHYASLNSVINLKKAHSVNQLCELIEFEVNMLSPIKINYYLEDLIENSKSSYTDHIQSILNLG